MFGKIKNQRPQVPGPRPKRHSRRPVLRRTTFLRRNLPYYALSGFTDAANRKEGVKVAARPRASLALCRLMPTHRASDALTSFTYEKEAMRPHQSSSTQGLGLPLLV